MQVPYVPDTPNSMIRRAIIMGVVAAAPGVVACSTQAKQVAGAGPRQEVISASHVGGPDSTLLAELRSDGRYRMLELVIVSGGWSAVLDRWEHFPSGVDMTLRDASVDNWPVVALVMVDEPSEGHSNVSVDLYELNGGTHVARVEGMGAAPLLTPNPGESCSLVMTDNPYGVENPGAGLWPRCHRVIVAGGGVRLSSVLEGRAYCGLLSAALEESRASISLMAPEPGGDGWVAAEYRRLEAHTNALQSAVNRCGRTEGSGRTAP